MQHEESPSVLGYADCDVVLDSIKAIKNEAINPIVFSAELVRRRCFYLDTIAFRPAAHLIEILIHSTVQMSLQKVQNEENVFRNYLDLLAQNVSFRPGFDFLQGHPLSPLRKPTESKADGCCSSLLYLEVALSRISVREAKKK